ncbi:MAG TPA: CehA/McbA family metallohydrolase, partial [Polyangia bacterium]
RAPRGSIVDVSLPGAEEDDLLEVTPVVITPAGEVLFKVRSVANDFRDGRPMIRIERRSLDGTLALWSEVRMRTGERTVELHHRLYNRGDEVVRGLQWGERARWALGASFLPEHGYVTQPLRAQARFVSWAGSALAYALVFPGKPVSIEARNEGHGGLEQVALGGRFDLRPDAHIDERRLLLVVPGALANANTAAFRALGYPLGRVKGRLAREALPATIEASLPNRGATLIASADAEGRFELALPAATYRMVAKSPGGEDVHQVPVVANETTVIDDFVPPRPGFLRFRIEDHAGRPLPGRLIVRGVAPTRDPNFGPAHRAAGAGNVVYSADGTGEVPLPAGIFAVTATHGPEFGIAQQRLKIGKGQGTTARFALEAQIDSTGWVSADLHVHSERSTDSQISIPDRVTSLLAEGVDVVASGDHNHVTDFQPAMAEMPVELGVVDRLLAMTGVEISTETPEWGHFSVYPYRLAAPPFSEVGPAAIFAAIRQRAPDAVIQVNHPRQEGMGYWTRAELNPLTGSGVAGYATDFDAVEVLGRVELSRPQALARNLSDWFALLNLGRRYTATAGSDSHQLIHQGTGYPRTYVQVEDDRPGTLTAAEVARAIKAGRTFVTSGPFLGVTVNGSGPGETVTATEGQVVVDIVVQAARWIDVRRIEVVVNGHVAFSQAVPERTDKVERARLRKGFALDSDAWVVVVVRGERALEAVLPQDGVLPVAFNSPIFVDVDGDGKFRAPRRAGESLDAAAGVRVDAGTAEPRRDR